MDGKKKKKFNDNRVRVINIESLLFVTHTHTYSIRYYLNSHLMDEGN